MSDIKTLLAQIRSCAETEPFPLDLPIYEAAKKEPTEPILYAGNLESQICFFGRDLGRDEVAAGQPLIGAAGKLVRQGFYQFFAPKKSSYPRGVTNSLLQGFVNQYRPLQTPRK